MIFYLRKFQYRFFVFFSCFFKSKYTVACTCTEYCNKNNTTLKVEKYNKYKNAENIVTLKVKKLKERKLSELFSKNPGRHQINCNIET